MLNDPERKLLRILNNCEVSKRPIPTYRELFRMTGRNEKMILVSLNLLQAAGFINWDGMYTQSIHILQGWENQQRPLQGDNYIGKH